MDFVIRFWNMKKEPTEEKRHVYEFLGFYFNELASAKRARFIVFVFLICAFSLIIKLWSISP
jgi:hypothetical protein